MENEYVMVIAGSMTRGAMRAGKRVGTACFLAYEDDAGEIQVGVGFRDGLGRAFEDIVLSQDEKEVLDTVLDEWRADCLGELSWIDLVVVAQMSALGPSGVKVGSSTVPRSLLKNPVRARLRRRAHAEPMKLQMERVAEVMFAQRGQTR